MKKISVIMVLLMTAVFILTSCGQPTKSSEPASLDGIKATLDKVETTTVPNGSTVFSTYVTITNESEENIMQVSYKITCKDKSGNELISGTKTYTAEERPIGKGESVEVEYGFQKVLDNEPATTTIEVTEVLTDKELAPVRVPKEGDYLYEAINDEKINHIKEEAPAIFVVGIDQGGYLREAVFDTPETIAEAVDNFTKITIAGETEEMVTDNYNYITFIWADGSSSGISLNLHNLELNINNNYHLYELDGLGSLWTLAEEYAEEVEY